MEWPLIQMIIWLMYATLAVFLLATLTWLVRDNDFKIVLRFCRNVAFIVMGAILVGMVLYIIYWNHETAKLYKGKIFTKEEWIRTAPGLPTKENPYGETRCKMYEDLRDNHLKRGITIAAVEGLLGNTELITYCIDKKIKCLEYYMGTCSTGSGVLEICFDETLQAISVGRDGHYSSSKLCGDKSIGCSKKLYGYKTASNLSNGYGCICYLNEDHISEKCPFEVNMW